MEIIIQLFERSAQLRPMIRGNLPQDQGTYISVRKLLKSRALKPLTAQIIANIPDLSGVGFCKACFSPFTPLLTCEL